MTTELIGMYSKDYDITFIMKQTRNDDGNLVSNEVTGFYHGEPTTTDNEMYDNQLTVTYDDGGIDNE